MHIDSLASGGLTTNYRGTARCAYCLYNCGPERESGYVSEADAGTICSIVRSCSCCSIHVGSGEPMLNQNFNDLKPVRYYG